eukprot:6174046-Pleurochrysis_carterae.AAC.1
MLARHTDRCSCIKDPCLSEVRTEGHTLGLMPLNTDSSANAALTWRAISTRIPSSSVSTKLSRRTPPPLSAFFDKVVGFGANAADGERVDAGAVGTAEDDAADAEERFDDAKADAACAWSFDKELFREVAPHKSTLPTLSAATLVAPRIRSRRCRR